jgi:hypothetical protein
MQVHDDHQKVRAALKDLSEICQGEYGISLESLLLDDSRDAALRLQRVTGIVLKRPFATRQPRTGGASMTGAQNAWPWRDEDPDKLASSAPELALLENLRTTGPWSRGNSYAYNQTPGEKIPWQAFKSDVEHERGLFKVLALWVSDQVDEKDRSLKEYLDAKESKRFEAGLDLAVLLADAAIMTPLGAFLGVPSVAIGIALVGIQYGYRWLTDENEGRIADESS